MMRTACCVMLLSFATAAAFAAPAPSAKKALEAVMAQVLKSPNEVSLREKAIALAKKAKPVPNEEAERRMARGAAAVADAKSPADYLAAAKEFEEATLVAPWWGDAYYNLGVAYDKGGKPVQALAALKLATLADPSSKDVKTFLYQAEFRAEKARDPFTALTGDWYVIDYPQETAASSSYWNNHVMSWKAASTPESLQLWQSRWAMSGKSQDYTPDDSDVLVTARLVNGEKVWTGTSRYTECGDKVSAPATVETKEDGAVLLVHMTVLMAKRVMEFEGQGGPVDVYRREGVVFSPFNGKCVRADNFTYHLGRMR